MLWYLPTPPPLNNIYFGYYISRVVTAIHPIIKRFIITAEVTKKNAMLPLSCSK